MTTYSYSATTSDDIKIYTVKTAGTYDIVAYGGAGGIGGGDTGGAGAEVGGTFVLQAGEKLKVIIGGVGGYHAHYGGGGGGGASTVLADVDAQGTLTPGTYSTVLLVAGGGGGGVFAGGGGGAGSAATGAPGGAGGASGGGASSGGGAGVRADGDTAASYQGRSGGGGGKTVANGSAGGAAGSYGGKGAFGGGGGGSYYGGGGGGGYTGGNGAGSRYAYTPGSGGTSFDAGTPNAAQTQSGVNTGAGKVLITQVVCFASGTLIRTMRDGREVDVAVEDLAVGDVAVTTSGARRPIRWLGHRRIDCRRHPRPHEAMPIRISAHALGENRPARDLFVSPGHAICVDVCGDVLIPAIALVNGSTIAQLEVDSVTYWHVELESHDVILAENLPAESYLDMGNRPFFAEADIIELAAAPMPTGRGGRPYLVASAGSALACCSGIGTPAAALAGPVRSAK